MPFELLKTLPPGSDQYRQIAQLLSYLNSAAVVVVPHFGGQEALQEYDLPLRKLAAAATFVMLDISPAGDLRLLCPTPGFAERATRLVNSKELGADELRKLRFRIDDCTPGEWPAEEKLTEPREESRRYVYPELIPGHASFRPSLFLNTQEMHLDLFENMADTLGLPHLSLYGPAAHAGSNPSILPPLYNANAPALSATSQPTLAQHIAPVAAASPPAVPHHPSTSRAKSQPDQPPMPMEGVEETQRLVTEREETTSLQSTIDKLSKLLEEKEDALADARKKAEHLEEKQATWDQTEGALLEWVAEKDGDVQKATARSDALTQEATVMKAELAGQGEHVGALEMRLKETEESRQRAKRNEAWARSFEDALRDRVVELEEHIIELEPGQVAFNVTDQTVIRVNNLPLHLTEYGKFKSLAAGLTNRFGGHKFSAPTSYSTEPRPFGIIIFQSPSQPDKTFGPRIAAQLNEYGQAEGIYAEEWNPLQSQVSVEFHAPAAYLITGNEIWDFIDEAERRCGFRASAIQQVPGRSTLQYPSVSVSTYVSKVMERRMFGEATAKVWVRKGRELWDFRYVPQQ